MFQYPYPPAPSPFQRGRGVMCQKFNDIRDILPPLFQRGGLGWGYSLRLPSGVLSLSKYVPLPHLDTFAHFESVLLPIIPGRKHSMTGSGMYRGARCSMIPFSVSPYSVSPLSSHLQPITQFIDSLQVFGFFHFGKIQHFPA
jgi:hypothetical protein